jgi:molecular chaperone IbpA
MTGPNLLNYLIGFDRFADGYRGLESNYPPFDLYKDGEKTIIEFALAGYSKENIEILLEDNTLKVSAKKDAKSDKDKYSYRGIAQRSFTKQFALSEYAVVDSAEHKDGVLRITISFVVPEEKKPKKIEIQ